MNYYFQINSYQVQNGVLTVYGYDDDWAAI